LFQTFFPGIFFFEHKKRKEKQRKKKTIEKKNVEKGRSFPLNSRSALSFLTPTSTLPLLPFCFQHFLLASSFSQAKEKGKKTIKKKKKCKEGRELNFKFLLCPLTFSFCFWPLVSTLLFQAPSLWHLLLFKQKKRKKNTQKKTI